MREGGRSPPITRQDSPLAADHHDLGWRLRGLVYVSASDPAVFVPKRGGIGQTLNLGRPAAWLFLAAVFFAPPAMILAAMARL